MVFATGFVETRLGKRKEADRAAWNAGQKISNHYSQAGATASEAKDTTFYRQAEFVLMILPDILAKVVRHAGQKG